MPKRVVALFLSFVLLWSGLSTIEAPSVVAQPAELMHAIVHDRGETAGHEGSVEDHHLDDLPVQAQSDLPSETPGLGPEYPAPRTPPVVMARPRTSTTTESGPPFLAGPLRPPCSASLAG